MYQENETIIANKDITPLILKNTIGVIHSVYENGKYYLVEFIDEFGDTIGDGLEKINCEDIDKYISSDMRHE